jgi:hypothetical protein
MQLNRKNNISALQADFGPAPILPGTLPLAVLFKAFSLPRPGHRLATQAESLVYHNLGHRPVRGTTQHQLP